MNVFFMILLFIITYIGSMFLSFYLKNTNIMGIGAIVCVTELFYLIYIMNKSK